MRISFHLLFTSTIVVALSLSLLLSGCGTRRQEETVTSDTVSFAKGSFGYDANFLARNKEVVILQDLKGQGKVLVVGDYQGRVMTSTSRGDLGLSYGWLNYDLIDAVTSQPHMNPYGGEDRFWIGPEGGQYAVFFTKGKSFDYENWQTPALIDTEPFELKTSLNGQATFTKSAMLTNYDSFTFEMEIERQIKLLDDKEIEKLYGIDVRNLSKVCFQTVNTIKNTGQEAWTKKRGLISIWILGMFNPSPATTIIIPYRNTPSSAAKVVDNYFGSISSERLVKTDSVLFFRGDGKSRGKIGIPPSIARNIQGSYDASRHVLTLVTFDIHPDRPYVNSKWETQTNPFDGDAVNAYNDGPLVKGGQLGPFYEHESSSPALDLAPGQKWTHHHTTLHLEGSEKELDAIMRKALGVSIETIEKAFIKK
ncbi:MAG: hypothetical protein JST46_11440 [Bacteroidetes bacterium]|nr:hypothetical protein [Bacteroidota bacterium]